MKPGERLSQRVARGGVWVFAIQVASETLSLARTVVLARLLAPTDFGLMGVAFLTMSILQSLTKTGFDKALIQKKGDIRGYLDTAWTVDGMRGTFLCVLIIALAPAAASFFDAPDATNIMRVVALSIFIGGWSNAGLVYIDKELKFNKKFIYQVGSSLVGLAVSVSAAVILRSVWALVFGVLAGNLTGFALSYILHPYRPHPRFELAKAKELFHFGKWIMGSTILVFLLTEGDDLFLGKVLGVTALGFYQMAYRISNLPASQIQGVVTEVTYPAYSKLQDSLPKLAEAYLNTLKFIAFLSFPMAAGVAVLAPDFTHLFLTDKWMPMVPAMQVLAAFGLIRSISATTGSIFQSIGRPDISTKLQFVRVVVLASIIYPFTSMWDITGTALAVVAVAVTMDPIAVLIAARVSGSRPLAVGRVLAPPVFNTAIMALSVFALKHYVFSPAGLPAFFFLIGFGALIYFASVYVFDRWLGYNMFSLLKEQISAIKG
jgi:lipopolysaccharide exporter